MAVYDIYSGWVFDYLNYRDRYIMSERAGGFVPPKYNTNVKGNDPGPAFYTVVLWV